MLSFLLDCIGIVCDGTPILRRFWSWLWERDMEMELREPHSQIVRGPTGLNIPTGTGPILEVHVGDNPHIHIWLDLVLTNHRTTRREVITNCELHLKKSFWLFWKQTIASAVVLIGQQPGINDKRTAWSPIILEPISPPTIITVIADGAIVYPLKQLPRKMQLVLEFSMIGPRKRMSRVLQDIRHAPK